MHSDYINLHNAHYDSTDDRRFKFKCCRSKEKESSFEKLEQYSVGPILFPMDLCQIPPLHLRNDRKKGCLTSLSLTSFFPHSRSNEGKNCHFLQQTMHAYHWSRYTGKRSEYPAITNMIQGTIDCSFISCIIHEYHLSKNMYTAFFKTSLTLRSKIYTIRNSTPLEQWIWHIQYSTISRWLWSMAKNYQNSAINEFLIYVVHAS